MNNSSAFKKKHNLFTGIDSDGCAFDTMELKHKECFCPSFIQFFGLQAISRYAREAWEFVNLYSVHRGTNRFKAALKTIDFLETHPAVNRLNFQLPDISSLRDWVKTTDKLGNPALKKSADDSGDTLLQHAYNWSLDINERINNMVENIPPFPHVRKALELLSRHSDCIVLSSANQKALEKEWGEAGINRYVQKIAGQEAGKKQDIIRETAGDKYKNTSMMIIGDSPGDYRAAVKFEALFYPIIPGKEASSWDRLYTEGIEKFQEGTFKGAYQEKLINDFYKELPTQPGWLR